ncbi:MAG: hypothetical protein WCF67_06480, partial [Chitinophagaceae bacterium]
MKKWLLILALFIFLLIAGIYIFIPSTLVVSKPVMVRSTEKGAARFLSDPGNWQRWNTKSNPSYIYKAIPQSSNPIIVYILAGKDTIASTISILPVQTDSIAVVWQCELPSSGLPFKKLAAYQRAGSIKEDMEAIMANFRAFIENTDSVYQLSIRNEKVKDTLLMAAKSITTGRPVIADV